MKPSTAAGSFICHTPEDMIYDLKQILKMHDK